MASQRTNRNFSPVRGMAALVVATVAVAVPSAGAAAPQDGAVQNPNWDPQPESMVIDVSNGPVVPADGPSPVDFGSLDAYRSDAPSEPGDAPDRESLPPGLTQVGGMIVPDAMVDGADMVPDAAFGFTDVPHPQGNIEEFCAFPDEVPPGVYDYNPRPGMEWPRFHTVYLNFTGGVLMSGGENSAENQSTIARTGHMFPVYAGGEQRAIAASQAVANDFADWAIRVVYLERPPKILPYTMVMVGGHYSDTTAGPSGGVAPLDCEDFGQRNVCYAFQNQAPATSQANVISQEIGHTLGLGHTQAPDSVMAAGYAPTNGGDLGFNDACASTVQVQGQGAACIGVNKCHCGVGDQQHDKNTLFAIFSPAGVDMVEPTIELTNPPDGSVFTEGEEIIVEFDPWDDVGGYGWKLLVENEAGEVLVDQVDYKRALEFTLTGLPVGVYTFTGIIQDHADHIVTHAITVEIVGDEDQGGTGSGTGGSDGGTGTLDPTDTDGGATDGGGSGSDGSGDDGGIVDVDEGCGCRSGARPFGSVAALLGLGLLGAGRRRRR